MCIRDRKSSWPYSATDKHVPVGRAATGSASASRSLRWAVGACRNSGIRRTDSSGVPTPALSVSETGTRIATAARSVLWAWRPARTATVRRVSGRTRRRFTGRHVTARTGVRQGALAGFGYGIFPLPESHQDRRRARIFLSCRFLPHFSSKASTSVP